MIRQIIVKVGLVALIGGMALTAQAAQLTVNKWQYGGGTAVNLNAPAYNGLGGAFNGSLTGAGAPFDSTIGNPSFVMYCVELSQNITVSGVFQNFSVVTGTSHFSAPEALQLAKLLTYANPLVEAAENKKLASTALQLAIWNVVYDSDLSVSPGAGSFFDKANSGASSDTEALANKFLLDSSNTINALQVFVLKSPANQDQLFWREGGVPASANIPEPTSLALALGAFGALGVATRRRRPVKA